MHTTTCCVWLLYRYKTCSAKPHWRYILSNVAGNMGLGLDVWYANHPWGYIQVKQGWNCHWPRCCCFTTTVPSKSSAATPNTLDQRACAIGVTCNPSGYKGNFNDLFLFFGWVIAPADARVICFRAFRCRESIHCHICSQHGF